MRSSLALTATAALVALALTGCTAPAPEPLATSGASSDAIEVAGEFGANPRVDFPTPVSPKTTQCTEVIAGDGRRLVEGQQALIALAVYNGSSGEVLQAPTGFTDSTDAIPIVLGGNTLPGLLKGLTCGSTGSRVAIVIPPSDAFGEAGNESIGVGPDDSLVVVYDVLQAFLTRADGAVRPSRDGFPAVVLAPDGRPGITVPKADPPKSTQVEVLKEGSGQVVESGDRVVVHYSGVLWDDNSVFDSTWEKGAPASFVVSDGSDSEVIPGFSEAIIGQKVGSQIGVIVPPSEGYGDQEQTGIPAGSTLFFVIDILGVVE